MLMDYSREQLRILTRISRMGSHPDVFRRLWDFVRHKHPDEPIHEELAELWSRMRIDAREIMPPNAFEKVDKTIRGPQIDESVWKIDFKPASKVTFLLGAGASAPSDIPTVDTLLSSLWDKAKKLHQKDVDKLAEFCSEHSIKNIEDLLTAAYFSNFAASKNSVISLLDYFLFSKRHDDETQSPFSQSSDVDASSISFLQETLQTLFSLLTSTMLDANPNPAHEAIVDFIQKHKKSSIITTNYDCCIDEALSNQNITIKKTIDSKDSQNLQSGIELIKMHGSINWAYCDSCQYAREFNFSSMKEAYANDTHSFPVIGICGNCTGPRRPMLVPPLSFKFMMFPSLIELWNLARLRIENAEYLIVIGYSFSDADNYITKIVSRSMSMKQEQKMIVVTTNQKLVSSLRSKFSVNIEKFDESRIIEVCKSCEQILPQILDKSKRTQATPLLPNSTE